MVQFYPTVAKSKKMAFRREHLTTVNVVQSPPMCTGARVRIQKMVKEDHLILNGKEGLITARDRLHQDIRYKVQITSRDS